jgi:hypothetical protein
VNSQTADLTVRRPTRWQASLFEAKAGCLRLRRWLLDRWVGRPRLHAVAMDLSTAPVLAAFEDSLWPADEADPRLVVGKIHNLRLAVKRFHGLEIAAGETFSFWRQLGRASSRRGFVEGRELREGCVIPAVGGGLCQLTNAIYDSALRAGLEVVERHRHSRVLPGSLAEQDRDATVFWNYLDLRLRAPFAWRLELELDDTHLRLRIRAAMPATERALPVQVRARAAIATGDCSTCDESECHRHTGLRSLSRHRTWLIEEEWPEFLAYFQAQRQTDDRSIGPSSADGRRSFAWPLLRAWAWLRWRVALWRKRPIPQARTQRLQRLAKAIGVRLRPDDLHVVVSQGLLPYLWRAGDLAGRRFDVLMSALPMTEIQTRLDAAAARHPHSPTLRDFRAPSWLIEAETQALAKAQQWLSPHAQILALAGARGECLPWRIVSPAPSMPVNERAADGKFRVLFPASSLARKGALELREALRGLPVRVLLPPGASETPDFWRGFDIEGIASLDEGVALADLVVLPAWVEHQPRGLLMALARNIPVIATDACGLAPSDAWRRVVEGDVSGLRAAVERVISAGRF